MSSIERVSNNEFVISPTLSCYDGNGTASRLHLVSQYELEIYIQNITLDHWSKNQPSYRGV